MQTITKLDGTPVPYDVLPPDGTVLLVLGPAEVGTLDDGTYYVFVQTPLGPSITTVPLKNLLKMFNPPPVI